MVKFLLPRVDIMGELKLKDFNSMKKCVKWIGSIGRGMTWDEHMAAALVERAQTGPPLFSMVITPFLLKLRAFRSDL